MKNKYEKNNFIALAVPDIRGDVKKSLFKIIDDNWVSSAGKEINIFEESIAKIAHSKYALATITGSAALHLALKTMDIGPGDKVLVPDLTFAATINSVILSGAIPIIIDINQYNWTLDIKLTEQAIKIHKPKAIIVVHTLGNPAEISELVSICKKYKVYLVEDAAGAISATYKKKPVGCFGQSGIFSFNGNKIITTGGGGALLFNSKKLYLKAKVLYSQARIGLEYNYNDVGYNYRMPNLNAVLGLAQLKYLAEMIKDKRRIALKYDKAFLDRKDIALMPRLKDGESSCWLYSIQTASKKDSLSLIKYLSEYSVQARLFWNALSLQTPYKKYIQHLNGVSHMLSGNIVSIPCSSSLKNKDQQKVIELINNWKGSSIAYN